MNIDEIRTELKGYHIEIELVPSGGVVSVSGCEECGTVDDLYESVMWRHRPSSRIKTIEEAVAQLVQRLKLTTKKATNLNRHAEGEA